MNNYKIINKGKSAFYAIDTKDDSPIVGNYITEEEAIIALGRWLERKQLENKLFEKGHNLINF